MSEFTVKKPLPAIPDGKVSGLGDKVSPAEDLETQLQTKMEGVTVEGAELAKEIAKKVNQDFDKKKLPLMLGMINAIVEDKKLDLNWELFR